MAGYDVAACSQSASVGEALRYLVTLPSAGCFLLCLVCLYFYPINEARRADNRQRLERLPCAPLTPARLRAHTFTPTARSPMQHAISPAQHSFRHFLCSSLDLSERINPEPEPASLPVPVHVPVVHTSRIYSHTGGVSALESRLDSISPPSYEESPSAAPFPSNGHLTSPYNKLPVSSASSRRETETRF